MIINRILVLKNRLSSYHLNELPPKYRKKAITGKKGRKIIHWTEEQNRGKVQIIKALSSGGTWS